MTQWYYHAELMPEVISPSHIPFIYDRTQKVLPRPEIIRITPIGDPNGERFTIPELCLARAKEIVEAANGRRIHVSWSGGIDSTSVLLALLEVVSPDDITVLMNEKSIAEYPWMYETIIKDKMQIVDLPEHRIEATLNDIILAGGIIVTGEIGDQMFGSIKFMDYEDQNDLMKPWTAVLDGVSDNTKAMYQKLADACPVPMTTVKMFWWWFNYVMKYQGVQLRMCLRSPDAKINENVFHFFDSKGFNDWCLYTPQEERFPGTDPLAYKKPLKDYILSQTGDAEYFRTKGKVQSLIIYRGRLSRLHEAKTIDKYWTRTF